MSPLGVIWTTLSRSQRRRFVVLQFLSVLMASSTVLGLAAVMVFLAVLADPALIDGHAPLRVLQDLVGGTSQEFMRLLGAAFSLVLISSAVLNVLGTRAAGRFAYSVGDRIREVLFAGYLRRDYLFHVRVGAGRLMDNVLNQSDRVTLTLLNGQLLFTNAVLTLLVVVSIAVVNPVVAAVGVLSLGGGYLVFYRLVRHRLAAHGRLQASLGAERIAVVEQSLFGIKYLLTSRAQPWVDQRLAAVTRAMSGSMAETQFIGRFPKYVLECLAGVALIACALFVSRGAANGAWLAQLSFFGLAGFRLLPAIQQIYAALVILRNNRPAIDNIAAELLSHPQAPATDTSAPAPISLQQAIELDAVSFRYAPHARRVLDEVSLRIAAGSVVGITGESGSGKTTLVDLVLGLLSPENGRIDIDGRRLEDATVPGWQASVGYVPQDVMILDASVRENIAFGLAPGEIDEARVREAAAGAGAAGFIESLPGGYAARLSANGANLSGGQRQRIGIARALYRRPVFLVLDEATNALDRDSERVVIDAVIRNRGARTLLIVAHGAALIDACDRVYELREGTLRERVPPLVPVRAAHE